MDEPLKHIRLCTFSMEDFSLEVISEDILSKDEIMSVLRAVKTNTREEGLTSICNDLCKRSYILSDKLGVTLARDHPYGYAYTSDNYIITKDKTLLLIEAVLKNGEHIYKQNVVPEGLYCKQEGKITFTRITDYSNNTSSETPVEVVFTDDVLYEAEFIVPLTSSGKNVRLLSRNKYKIQMKFTELIWYYNNKNSNCDYVYLKYINGASERSFIKELRYKTVVVKADKDQ